MRDTITLNGITYGTTAADIISGNVALGESLAASSLSVDTLTVEITAKSAPEGVYGDVVEYLRDGSIFGKFYLRTIERVSKFKWKLDAVSAVGTLDNVKHYGGLYDGRDSTSSAVSVIASIIGDAFTYTVTGFDDVQLYGWLPIASKRENLQQVLFAIGGNITKDANGDVVISPLSNPANLPQIGKERIFLGGKVTYPVGASAVRVTEHSFVPSAEAVEIYNGEVFANTIQPPSGGSTSENLYDTSMETSHWYAGSGLVVDTVDHFDSVIIECEPMNTYVATRTRFRESDILRICWLKELPVTSYETIAYDNRIAYPGGTVGDTMTAQTTTGVGAKYLLITYGYTEDTDAKNSLDVRKITYAGQLVEFDEPIWGLECTGAEIYESAANYAILSPSPMAILTGKRYIHNQKIITAYAEDASGSDYVPEVKNCTLVSLANSANVAKRVLAYYSGFKRVEQDIVVNGEKPGDRVVLFDPYGEKSGGYIKTLDLTMGALLRGKAVFETGYLPTGIGNNYEQVIIVDESGTVQLPDTNMIRLVLIGGGSGGNGGYPGEDGKQPSTSSSSSQILYAALEKDGDPYWQMTNTIYGTADTWINGPRAEIVRYSGSDNAQVTGIKMQHYLDQHPNSGIDPNRINVIQAVQAGYGNKLTSINTYTKILGHNASGSHCQCQNYKAVAKQGTAGENWAIYDVLTPGGSGGSGGAGGIGGKVFIADVEITPNGTMTVSLGSGGAGGDPADGVEGHDPAGASGTETTVTVNGSTLSSADGMEYPEGYFDIIGGGRYGGIGDVGLAGGAGGASEGYYDVYPGEDVGEYTGGGVIDSGTTNPSGSGGGASGTANGGTGAKAVSNHRGSGGAGASATSAPPAPAVGGQGGTGGYGGGGGGNAAGWRPTSTTFHLADPAPGGNGSSGGVGASGIVLIYYGDPVDIPPDNALKDWYRQTMIDSDSKIIAVPGGYRSKFSGWQIDDFIEEVLNG